MDKNVRTLIKQSINGSLDAFGKIVSRYQSNVCAVTYSITGDISASEDLAQETFIAAWKGLGTIEDINSFLPWLCGIARNKAYNWLKRTARHKATSIADVPELPEPDKSGDIELKEQYGSLLWSAVGELEEGYREPLVMYYRNNKSIREVAVSLELSETAVRQRLNRARKMLRSQVADKIEDMIRDTGPGKMFSGAVVSAIISAGLAESAAASTVVSAFMPATSVSSGFIATLTGKALITAVAAVTIMATIAVYVPKLDFQTSKAETKSPDFRQIVPLSEPNRIDDLPNTADLPVSEQPSETASVKVVPPAQGNKQVPECVYAYFDDRETSNEFWVKGDKKWRVKVDNYEEICDGVKVLILDHEKKMFYFRKSMPEQLEGITYLLTLARKFSENIDPQKNISTVNFGRNKHTAKRNYDANSGDNEVVFDVFDPNSEQLLASAWLSIKTARVNYLQFSELHGGNGVNFNYDSLDDDMFSTAIPPDYDLEQSSSISGFVFDEYGQAVTDAIIYVDGKTEGPPKELVAKTDLYGYFECPLDFKQPYWGISYPVAIRAVSKSRPELVAWTIIADPDIKIPNWPEWLGRLNSNAVVRKKKVLGIEFCGLIQNITMYMEPCGTISGLVTNKAGSPIEDAKITMSISGYITADGIGTMSYLGSERCGLQAFTNSEGYYELLGVPKLKGGLLKDASYHKSYYINVSAENYCHENISGNEGEPFKGIENEVYDFQLEPAGLTLTGRVIDNYGEPLVYYGGIEVSADGHNWYPSTNLDEQGRFTIQNAPFAEKLILRKNSYDDCYEWANNDNTKGLDFMPYGEKTFEVQIPAGVNKYDVGELVMEFPDIIAEVYVVDFEGNPVGSVECIWDRITCKELENRYTKVTDKDTGRCTFENLPRINSGKPIIGTGNIYFPISLRRPAGESGSKYCSSDYHFKYPGDYKRYIFELVLPLSGHYEQRRMRVYSPDGALLLETNGE